jgi:hypothetical protein
MAIKTVLAYFSVLTLLVMLISDMAVTPAAAKMCWPPSNTNCQYGGAGGPQRQHKPGQAQKPSGGQTTTK